MHTKSARLMTGGILGALALACATAPPAAATYEGNNGRIAFGAFFASNRQADIWSIRPGEDELHQLTNAPGHDICPAYSADGKQIAFCSDRTGAYEIWVMDANGKHERQVTQLGTYAVFPDFSPDGRRLAFSARSAGESNTDLWLVPTAGGAPTQLTNTPDSLEENPVWSPDGTSILFVRIAGDFSGGQLWTMDVASGQQTQLTFDPTFKDQTPDWSPDGTRIAYARRRRHLDHERRRHRSGQPDRQPRRRVRHRVLTRRHPDRLRRDRWPRARGAALRPDHPHRRLRPPRRGPHSGTAPSRPRLAAPGQRPIEAGSAPQKVVARATPVPPAISHHHDAADGGVQVSLSADGCGSADRDTCTGS